MSERCDNPDCGAGIADLGALYDAALNMIRVLNEQIAMLQREQDEAELLLETCHNARTRESIEYGKLCVEMVDASGVETGGGITAVQAVQVLREELAERDAELARLREVLMPFAVFASALEGMNGARAVVRYGHQWLKVSNFTDAYEQLREPEKTAEPPASTVTENTKP